MTKRFAILAVVVALFVARVPTLAHHGQAAYDNSVPVTVTGTVTEFQFVNPHCIVYLAVKDASGETQKWQGGLDRPLRAGRRSDRADRLAGEERSELALDHRDGRQWQRAQDSHGSLMVCTMRVPRRRRGP